ncbi:MAG TPA: DEAD/DEAH box helicase [Trueperaceae bacterium]|nr:DEAD/DEAH box helicase [Trueperaceae bacterium]HRQ10628.1 DEAD/DEAH box helicase [Trueperaceae bacterium]
MQNEVSFDGFNLDPRVVIGVRAAGYVKPTPIQEQTVTAAMAGRHVLGLAQTGTGKTAAFVLPILHRLLLGSGPEGQRHGGRGSRRVIRALVVAPTRELAEQINDEFRTLGQSTGLRSATVYGGVGFQPQIDALRGRADIIVACPGRLLDHMQRGNANLTDVEVLVIDEADHMFDMGFLPPIRQILRAVPVEAQRLLFSATMPDEVAYLADEILTDPLKVEINRIMPAETIDHALIPVDEANKTALLLDLLKKNDLRSVLVFTRTKHRAKRLAATLDKANHFVAELQGNLSQRRRQEALDGFKQGKYHVLVATDIAARGIDVARVSHVINYDFPDTSEAYTHRIGRTGRAEHSGEALTFVTANDLDNVRQLERRLRMRIERRPVDGISGPAGALEATDSRSDRPRAGGAGRGPRRGSNNGRGPRPSGAAAGGSRVGRDNAHRGGGAEGQRRDPQADARRDQPGQRGAAARGQGGQGSGQGGHGNRDKGAANANSEGQRRSSNRRGPGRRQPTARSE